MRLARCPSKFLVRGWASLHIAKGVPGGPLVRRLPGRVTRSCICRGGVGTAQRNLVGYYASRPSSTFRICQLSNLREWTWSSWPQRVE